MSKVYSMGWVEAEDARVFSVFPDNDTGLTEHEEVRLREGEDEFPCACHFQEIVEAERGLEYSDASEGDDVWLDYPANRFAWPILSERFMATVRDNTTALEGIDWIRVQIRHFREARTYYVLRFNSLHDVLDTESTLYNKSADSIIRPCLKEAAFDRLQIATIPAPFELWRIPLHIYVSERLKKVIQSSGITGVDFWKAKSTGVGSAGAASSAAPGLSRETGQIVIQPPSEGGASGLRLKRKE